jgi:hypothetical protein
MRILIPIFFLLLAGCSKHMAPPVDADVGAPLLDAGADGSVEMVDAQMLRDAGPPDSSTALALTCSEITSPPNPGPCPALSGAAGKASFCFRAGWVGATSVDVYGGFGQATDWKMPFLSLMNDGTGTFTGTANVPNGNYPYMFRVKGSTDAIMAYDVAVKDLNKGQWMTDITNPSSVPAPIGAPVYIAGAAMQKVVSSVTVPQVAAPVHEIKGVLTFRGVPQPCYTVQVRTGAPRAYYSSASNFSETGADGTFHFFAADGAAFITVQYPFFGGPYPDLSTTPVIGWGQTGATIAGADLTLDPLDIFVDYSAFSPPTHSMSVALPVTFTYSLLPNAKNAALGVNIASDPGGDPLVKYGPYSTATSFTFDGAGTYGPVTAGKQYYWSLWQNLKPAQAGGTTWSEQSLNLPITFQ